MKTLVSFHEKRSMVEIKLLKDKLKRQGTYPNMIIHYSNKKTTQLEKRKEPKVQQS
jgi:hypothetical protein